MTPAGYALISVGSLAASLAALAFTWALLRRSRQTTRIVDAIGDVGAGVSELASHAYAANRLQALGLASRRDALRRRPQDPASLLDGAYANGPLDADTPTSTEHNP